MLPIFARYHRFTLTTSLPQVLTWMKLLEKVQDGELQL
jgi:hypothetical protein